MSIRFKAVLVGLTLLSAGCASNVQREITPTSTLFLLTSTLPVSPPSAPSQTPAPPASQPTAAPVDGITSTQVNVRAEPSTSGTVLGIIPADMRVEITGKDPAGNWWQIIYPHPDALDGKGWVTSQFVTLPSTAEVPVIGAGPDPESGNVAIVQEQINVRSGPGTDFNSLGTLNSQDVVRLTGKDSDGAWLQIEFVVGPEGKGWINAAFVQAQGVENLPIVAESGQVVGTGTPTGIPVTPTPTIVPARDDGDSALRPAVHVVFEPNGTQTFQYNGDLSSPQGDVEDWIAFQPYGPSIFASLECTGSNSIEIQLLENQRALPTYIKCGTQREQIAVQPGSSYLVHLRAIPSDSGLQYTNYLLTIKTRP